MDLLRNSQCTLGLVPRGLRPVRGIAHVHPVVREAGQGLSVVLKRGDSPHGHIEQARQVVRLGESDPPEGENAFRDFSTACCAWKQAVSVGPSGNESTCRDLSVIRERPQRIQGDNESKEGAWQAECLLSYLLLGACVHTETLC